MRQGTGAGDAAQADERTTGVAASGYLEKIRSADDEDEVEGVEVVVYDQLTIERQGRTDSIEEVGGGRLHSHLARRLHEEEMRGFADQAACISYWSRESTLVLAWYLRLLRHKSFMDSHSAFFLMDLPTQRREKCSTVVAAETP
jgi:hypothetical protein